MVYTLIAVASLYTLLAVASIIVDQIPKTIDHVMWSEIITAKMKPITIFKLYTDKKPGYLGIFSFYWCLSFSYQTWDTFLCGSILIFDNAAVI